MRLRAVSRSARLLAHHTPLRAATGGPQPRRPPPFPAAAAAGGTPAAAADPPPRPSPAAPLLEGDVLRAVASSIPGARADTLADALLAYGALSASVEEDLGGEGAGQVVETPLFGPDRSGGAVWPACRVTAIFPAAGCDVGAATAAAAAAAGMAGPAPAWAVSAADAGEWAASLHGDFRALAVNFGAGAPLWVVPAWCEVPAEAAAATVVRLTPGLAFGTGDHPTTRMCLRWLAGGVGEVEEEGEEGSGGGAPPDTPSPAPSSPLRGLVGGRLLDYGAGSGILAVAGLALGAAAATATDTDRLAIRAAAENGALNGVGARLEARLVVGDGASDAPLPPAHFAVVVANILQGPLLALAPLLAAAAAPGGAVAVAGILADQAPAVAAALRAGGVEVRVAAAEGGWVLLAGRKVGV